MDNHFDAWPNGTFRLGKWLVSPTLNRLSRGDTVAHLRPKVMDVLVVLAAHPGEVVAKDAILAAVWSKRFLADAALSRAVCELREILGDQAHHPSYIETVPKRGYRLIAAVDIGGLSLDRTRSCGAGSGAAETRVRPSGLATWLTLVASLLLLTGLATGHRAGTPHTGSGHVAKRILVLPFETLGSLEDDDLAVGVSDEIAGRLTKVGGVAVVSPPRRLGPARGGFATGDFGRRFSADYILVGSLQRVPDEGSPKRVRITPRLVRVRDSTEVWSAAYQYEIEDIFRIQSEIAYAVINEIGIALTDPQRRAIERTPTSSVEAWQAFLRGVHYIRLPEPKVADAQLALRMFERAVARDPNFAAAHAAIGHAHSLLYHYGLRTVEEHRVRAREALERALALEPDDPNVHLYHAVYLYWCDRAYDAALAEVATARRALPASPYPLEVAGLILRRRGNWEAAVTSFQQSSHLNPGDALAVHQAGVTLDLMRRFQEADACFDTAIAALPDDPRTYGAKAENLWRWNGDLGAARRALETAPREDATSLARTWFWQEVFERRYDEAIDRLRRLPPHAAGLGDLQEPPALLLATAQRLSGDRQAARASYRAALLTLERALRTTPDNPYLRVFRGIALAGLGDTARAVQEADRAVHVCPIAADAVDGCEVLEAAAEAYALAGQATRAIDALATLLSVHSRVSVASLEVDPRWQPLRGVPGFNALLGERATPPPRAANAPHDADAATAGSPG
jgi:DNA-binding winged helix-turn-helix (wHTH) protein/tetratricopeptide (TPR) repeat protein